MTGVELIVAALAAGAGAGTSAAAVDAYVGLRDALRRRLAGRGQAEQILHEDAGSTVWEQRIAIELADSGADRDELVLAAANRLLDLVDPDRSRTGGHTVSLHGARGVQVGDGTLHVETAYGPTAATMTGPVTVSYGQLPDPPSRPEA
ncbi:hypothetical protein [Micromonospora sp. NBRC 101691]|uniref:hypothetical protein n=1 Tax=Micromonospora sp. NBRC 101691 TaxID=3032198 RepID=UPI0024A3CAB0|nr:hypothetical protein [Micromonospora sp. NBRC 101691]GLY25069.1 hypothetical protein Misp04_48010 [Micromonospora sp. NBRC 101691]